MSDVSPLEQLFTDSGQIDQTELANILKEYVMIQRGLGTIIFSGKGSKLPAGKKIVVYLLAKKAFALVPGDGGASEDVQSGVVAKETGLKSGTVDPTLKKLREQGLVQSINGKYSVPNIKWQDVKDFLKE